MKKNLILLLILVLSGLSSAYAQSPPPYDYKVNRNLATPITSQPNGVPAYGAVSQYGEVYEAKKPGLVACSAAATGTTSTVILAGATGLGHIVSSVWCHNNSAVGSIVTVRNDGNSIGSIYLGTTAIGNNKHVFEYVNPNYILTAKDLTFIMTTTGTSTICCANYLNDINTTPTPTNTPTATPTP